MNIIRDNFPPILLAISLGGLAWIYGCTPDGAQSISHGMNSYVKLITLEDGTKCAVYVGSHGGGSIDCNWGNK